jgi:archaellum component FlaC
MLDEPLKKMAEISHDLKERYHDDREFYEKMGGNSEIALKILTDSENLDPNIKLLVSIAAYSEIRSKLVYSKYLLALNALSRLSLMTQFSIITIANELSQLKQQQSTPQIEANIEKISKIEEELAKLNKEFGRYSPTLKKFKQALVQTERTLRDNR